MTTHATDLEVPAVRRYGLAVLAVAAATGLRVALSPVLTRHEHHLLFTLAILVAARFAGLGAGLFATLLALLSALFLFTEPHFSLVANDPAALPNLALLAGVGVAISLLSEQVRSALALTAQSQERFRLLSEAVPEFIWTARADGQWDHVNARWIEYTGRPGEEQTDLSWLRQVHPDDQQTVLQEWARSVSNGSDFHAEGRIRRHDGVYRWFAWRAVAVRDPAGKVAHWFGSSADVQEEHEIQEVLRDQNKRLTAIAATAPGVIWSFQLAPGGAMSMPYASLRLTEIYGLNPAEVKDDASAIFARMHPDDVEHVRASMAESARTMTPWQDDFRVLNPSKGEIWVEGRSAPVAEPSGGVLWHGFITDVTARKKLEREAETNRREVRALAARLMTAQDEERRRISRELHDDLCQQLGALAMDLGAFSARLPVADMHRSWIEMLQARAARASEEVRHIAYRLHPSMLDDLGLVPSLRALCSEFRQREGIEVDLTGGGLRAPLGREAAACLYRVTQEALQNVAKHARAAHVWVSLHERDHNVVLSIEDDGAGFVAAAARGEGGLGLVSMEERARLAGGTLSMESQPGEGTRIWVTVPVPDGAAEQAADA